VHAAENVAAYGESVDLYRYLTAVVVVAVAGKPLLANEISAADLIARQHAATEKAIRRSQVVVWGKMDGGTGSTSAGFVEIVVQRLFKGSLESPRIRVRVHRKLTRDDREAFSAWFLVKRGDGIYKEVAPASLMADYYFMDVAARLDRTPFSGMQPRRVADGIVLDLGIDLGLGRVSTAPVETIRSDRVMLVAQVTNFGAVRKVLGRSESSELGKGNPSIALEITDRDGHDATGPAPRIMCGNLSELGDFVDLRDGETLKFMVSLHYGNLRAGTYRARLHYSVTRDIERLNVDGEFHTPDRGTLTKAKALWEGTVTSDWITFNVEAAPASAR
jgi:hypothetical protein